MSSNRHQQGTTTGGIDPQAFGEDWAHREFGEEESDYQVATQYMPDMFAALRTPV